MQKEYGDEVEFVLVYIDEAHALDSAWPILRGGAPLVEEPLSYEERCAVARKCAVGLALRDFTIVVDRMDNKVGRAYAAHPDRLYLVGKDGRIAFAGAPGPRGFRPEELERAIRRELGLDGGERD